MHHSPTTVRRQLCLARVGGGRLEKPTPGYDHDVLSRTLRKSDGNIGDRNLATEEELENRVSEVSDHWPERSDWGCLLTSDRHPAMGGGLGAYFWLSSRDEVLHFIRDVELPLLCLHDTHWEPALADAQRAVERALADDLSMDDARREINRLFESYEQIEWWGSMKELLTGEGEFAQGERIAFHDDESPAGLTSDEEDDFYEFLSDRGTY